MIIVLFLYWSQLKLKIEANGILETEFPYIGSFPSIFSFFRNCHNPDRRISCREMWV